MGARFAKWRAVIHVTEHLPTSACVSANAHALARYAAEHKEPLELGGVDASVEQVLGRFWCTEIARHDRRRLAFAVWSVLSARLLSAETTSEPTFAQP